MSPSTRPSSSLMLVLLLTFLSLASASSPFSFKFLHSRQSSTNSSSATCQEYSSVANLSVIGSNATYRAAYLAASPEGSDPARAPLDTAITQLPALEFDKALNTECGNLTTVAFKEAEANFTNGIVLQFKVNAGGRESVAVLRVGAVAAMVVGLGMLL